MAQVIENRTHLGASVYLSGTLEKGEVKLTVKNESTCAVIVAQLNWTELTNCYVLEEKKNLIILPEQVQLYAALRATNPAQTWKYRYIVQQLYTSSCIENSVLFGQVAGKGYHFSAPHNHVVFSLDNNGPAPVSVNVAWTSLQNCSPSAPSNTASNVPANTEVLHATLAPIEYSKGYSYRYNATQQQQPNLNTLMNNLSVQEKPQVKPQPKPTVTEPVKPVQPTPVKQQEPAKPVQQPTPAVPAPSLDTNISASVNQVISANKPFVDPEFKHDYTSVYHTGYKEKKLDLVWKRARDVMKSAPEVFKSGIEPNDIKQGELGDCWFLSALAGVAKYQVFVENLFYTKTFNNAGIYELKLFKGGVETRVVVDEYIPCYNYSTPIPAFSKNNDAELWVMLLEKAYAKIHGTYSRLIMGVADNALQDLTGCPTIEMNFSNENIKPKIANKSLFNDIKNYINLGYMLVCPTPGESDAEKSNQGLVLGHYYTLLDAKEAFNVKLLKLRNPWSQDVWKGDWSDSDTSHWNAQTKAAFGYEKADDGCFFITFEDFVKNFTRVGVAVTDKSFRDYRFKAEMNSSLECVSHTLVIQKSNTTVYLTVHQEDIRIATAKPYANVGAFIVDANTKLAVADSGTGKARSSSTCLTLNEGTYMIVPYGFANQTFAISVHCNKAFSASKEPTPYAFCKTRNMYEWMADVCIADQSEIVPTAQIKLHRHTTTGEVTVAAISDTVHNVTVTFTLRNLTCRTPTNSANPSKVTVATKSKTPVFIARLTSVNSEEGYSYNFSYSY